MDWTADAERQHGAIARSQMDWTADAERQHGAIARSQIGPTDRTADRLVQRGVLRRAGPSVFVVSGTPDTPLQRAWTATLGGRGTLRGRAAGYVWGMVSDWPDEIELYVPRGRSRCPIDGVVLCRRDLGTKETAQVDGLPVTTRSQTVLDCIGDLRLTKALPLADRALQQGWVSREAMQRRLRGRRRGNARLRQVLALVGDGKAEFEAERTAQRVLRAADVTDWVANLTVWIGGRKVVLDLAFPDCRLAIEIDGFAYHSESDRFQKDRERQNLLVADGWTVLRFTWQDLIDRPDEFVDSIVQRRAALMGRYGRELRNG